MEGDWLACPQCGKTTCTICKTVAHTGDCPSDTALQQLVDTANKESWQRCFQCHRFVDLEQGCNHMTCPCGAQFCYICGSRWKTCECPQWEEPRLYARATQIAQRDADPRRRLFRPQRTIRAQPQIPAHSASSSMGMTSKATEQPSSQDVGWESDFSDHSQWEQDWTDAGESAAPPALPSGASRFSNEQGAKPLESVFPPAIGLNPTIHEHDTARSPDLQSLVTHLRENHDCSHDRWRWLKGPHYCEQCHHRLPSYIFECKKCFLQACNRCRRNRLQ